MTERLNANTIDDDALDALYARAERAEAAIERVRAYCDVRDTEARRLTGEPTAVDVFAEILRHKLDGTREQ